MQSSIQRIVFPLIWVFFSLVIGIGSVQAEEKRDMQGSGIDDPYNQLYDVGEFERIRAWVLDRLLDPIQGGRPSFYIKLTPSSGF